jgi:hypothetical protein
VSTQVAGIPNIRTKEEDNWDEAAWQRELDSHPFMPGVDDAKIKEEENSDEEPWPPAVPEAPRRQIRRSPKAAPRHQIQRRRIHRTKITIVTGARRVYSLEAEYGILCLGFDLVAVVVVAVLLLLFW